MNAKETFLKGPWRKGFEELAQTETFRIGLEYALLVQIQEQPLGSTPSEAWDAHSQIVGARRFIEILSKLHVVEQIRKPPMLPNLKP